MIEKKIVFAILKSFVVPQFMPDALLLYLVYSRDAIQARFQEKRLQNNLKIRVKQI